MMVSFVLQWFVCLFCNDNIFEEITEIIWDFFLVDGVIVLFKAALAYFDLLKPIILQCTDFGTPILTQNPTVLCKNSTLNKSKMSATFERGSSKQIYQLPFYFYSNKNSCVTNFKLRAELRIKR